MPYSEEPALRTVAAKTIQRKWQFFIRSARSIINDIISIIQSVDGQKIEESALQIAVKKEKIIVRVTAPNKEDFFSGHAAFFMGNPMRGYDLAITMEPDPTAAVSSKYKARLPMKNVKELVLVYSGLYRGVIDLWELDKMKHLATKGELYGVPSRYIPMLEEAVQDEIDCFGQQNYSYGYHYNCYTYIRNCLRRLANKVEQSSLPSFSGKKLEQKSQGIAHKKQDDSLRESTTSESSKLLSKLPGIIRLKYLMWDSQASEKSEENTKRFER